MRLCLPHTGGGKGLYLYALPAALSLSARGSGPRAALGRPDRGDVIILRESARAFWQHHPILFGARENVHVGRRSVWIVERPHADKGKRVVGIVAPYSHPAGRAAHDLLAPPAGRRREYQFGCAGQKRDAR